MDRRILLAAIVLALGGSEEASPRGGGPRLFVGPARLVSSVTVAACAIPDGSGRYVTLEASAYEENEEGGEAKRTTRVVEAVLRFSDGSSTSLARARHELGKSSTKLFETLAYSAKRGEVWLFACGRGQFADIWTRSPPFVAARKVWGPNTEPAHGSAKWEPPARLDFSQVDRLEAHMYSDFIIREAGERFDAIAAVGNSVGAFYVMLATPAARQTRMYHFDADAEPRSAWRQLPPIRDWEFDSPPK